MVDLAAQLDCDSVSWGRAPVFVPSKLLPLVWDPMVCGSAVACVVGELLCLTAQLVSHAALTLPLEDCFVWEVGGLAGDEGELC